MLVGHMTDLKCGEEEIPLTGMLPVPAFSEPLRDACRNLVDALPSAKLQEAMTRLADLFKGDAPEAVPAASLVGERVYCVRCNGTGKIRHPDDK